MDESAAAVVEQLSWPSEITDAEFALFQALVQKETGIQLPEVKRSLLVGRLARRVRELRLRTFGEYYRRVTVDGDAAERMNLFDRIATNETRFFREPRHFEYLERQILPGWLAQAEARRRRVRVWSAACSTGEEPYSLAMTLLAALKGWQIDIFASDLSTHALRRAESAMWPIAKADEIPERHLKAFMLKGTGAYAAFMKAGPELRELVRFRRVNLHDDGAGPEGPFDLVFCRNVLIYFSPEGRARVVEKLLSSLAPDGYLFVGHAETLSGITGRLRAVEPTIYAFPSSSREYSS
jgi:chemotaxis protein methyltransferase CheR